METQRINIFDKIRSQSLELADFDYLDKTLLKFLDESNLIGSGAVGKVYRVGDLVIKKISPCDADPEKPLYKYCESLKKSHFTLIPGGDGQFRYMLPNLITEITIGMILSERFPDYFTATLGSFIVGDSVNDLRSSASIYIVMEALNSNIADTFQYSENKTKDFLSMLFQVSYSILQSQTSYKFTHYDLHIENILWKSREDYRDYPLPNSDLSLSLDSSFSYKISDFALGRLETPDIIISSEIDTFPIKSYDEFSPSYDILSFLGSIVIDNKYRKKFRSLFLQDLDLYKFMLMLLLWVWNDKEISIRNVRTLSDLDRIRDEIGNRYYTKIRVKKTYEDDRSETKFTFRPITQDDFIKYYDTKSMSSIVNFLARILKGKGYAEFLNTGTFNYAKKYDKVRHFDPNLEIYGTPQENKSIYRYQEMRIDDGISARAYHIKTNFPPAAYNFTLSDKQLEECPIQDHYLNTIYVKNSALEKYKFQLDCCKLDTVNYLLNNNKTGFAINGGFFQIKKDFLPIGIYQDEFFTLNEKYVENVSNYEIPEEYKDVFGNVVIRNNQLKIRKYRKKVREDEEIFTTGPLLIKDGKVVFDPNQMRYICTDEKNSKDIMISQDETTITTKGYYKYSSDGKTCKKHFVPKIKTYARCDKIQPSELSHANNPNPRSALCVLSNGDYIFITAEGRGKRGVGFDLYTLALTISENFPNVVDAINLDGGRSSILAWRTVERPDRVYISNADRSYVYPVGNILTFIQK